MKIIATSDFHGYLPKIPACDILLIGGDICPVWNHELEFQREWLFNEFQDWLLHVPAKTVVGIAGNHDLIMFEEGNVPRSLPWHYLENSSVTVEGLKIWGSPLSMRYGKRWVFAKTENDIGPIWAQIPTDTDILLVHGPPLHCLDTVSPTETRLGSESLRDRIVEVKPKAVVFGHIHEAYGRDHIGPTRCYNVAHCGDVVTIEDGVYVHTYEPINPPLAVDVTTPSILRD